MPLAKHGQLSLSLSLANKRRQKQCPMVKAGQPGYEVADGGLIRHKRIYNF
jgi:hypothetical protein